MGGSGAGKSTIAAALAERLQWTFEDGDRFHPKSNVAKMSAGHPLTDEDRRPWLQAIADEIDRVCEAGGHVVMACSTLKRAYREILVHGRSDIRIVFLDGSQALIADRLVRAKGQFMPQGMRHPPAPAEGPFQAPGLGGQPVQSAGAAPSRRPSVAHLHLRSNRYHRRQHC